MVMRLSSYHSLIRNTVTSSESPSILSLLARMVNFQDPNVIAQEMWALVNLWHAFDGIFLWEFFTTLHFEWSFIRGNRPYRWTIWIFSYFGLACASLLLMIRVVAVWKRNKIILALATTVWITNVAFLIQGVVRIRSGGWGQGCVLSNSDTAKLNFIATLATDTILFLMVLAGLLHLRLQGGGMFSLGDFLWKQGLIWFLLAAVAEVPPTVFLILDLNYTLNIMFQLPALIVLTIAATRMYRSLINFSSEMADGVLISRRSFPMVNVHSGVIPPTRMHVAIHTTREHDSMSQTSEFNPYVCTHVKAWEIEMYWTCMDVGSRFTHTFGERHVQVLDVGGNRTALNAIISDSFDRHGTAAYPRHSPNSQHSRPTHPSSFSPSHVSLVKLPSSITATTSTCTNGQSPNPSAGPPYSPALVKGGGIGWQRPTILERTARHFVNAFLARRAHALRVCIKGDPSAHVQHFDAGTDGADGKLRELVISYLSPRFFTLRVLAGVGAAARHKRRARMLEVGRPLHPLMPENWVAQGGFAVLLCALVATEWAEELLWRIARVRWAVINSMQRHPSGMVPVPS
ncbi:hypothetical protein BGW80DRAFT_1444701 [Lactifluus volemus]|nr:hypothetical protein BGW80DRAFT_1444701 [Lactifluus volemus]